MAARRAVVLGFADEESIVQTRFATAVLALLRASLGHDIEAAAGDAARALRAPLPLDPEAVDHFVFLGSGWSGGLANEAALQLREIAGAWSEAYPAMEYRHGPISVAGPRSAIWPLGHAPEDVLAEVEKTGATVVRNGLDPMAELFFAQRVAVAAARLRGLNPDLPRDLARSVFLSQRK